MCRAQVDAVSSDGAPAPRRHAEDTPAVPLPFCLVSVQTPVLPSHVTVPTVDRRDASSARECCSLLISAQT